VNAKGGDSFHHADRGRAARRGSKLGGGSPLPRHREGGMPSVLLVEDQPEVLRVLCQGVSHFGYDAICVGGFAEAIEHLRSGVPDLLVADVRLPDGSGLDLAAKARELGKPVILMTGYPEVARLLDERGISYLPKPFRFAEFAAVMRGFLGPGTAVQ
jgi:DNA-binding response OmpR family regulator